MLFKAKSHLSIFRTSNLLSLTSEFLLVSFSVTKFRKPASAEFKKDFRIKLGELSS